MSKLIMDHMKQIDKRQIQSEIARLLGTTQPMVSKWLRGKNPIPWEHYPIIMRHLQIDQDELLAAAHEDYKNLFSMKARSASQADAFIKFVDSYEAVRKRASGEMPRLHGKFKELIPKVMKLPPSDIAMIEIVHDYGSEGYRFKSCRAHHTFPATIHAFPRFCIEFSAFHRSCCSLVKSDRFLSNVTVFGPPVLLKR